jgi:EAL domain-containing protein (putative c-di-GMP-specific phosphodiesterase class I)
MACMTQILLQAPNLPGSAFLSMNVHLDTLYLFPDFSNYLLKVLNAQRFAPERVILEIGALSEWAPGRGDLDAIRELREHGVRFALDDFGSGSSNFDLLLEMRPELIKLSPCLTQGLMEDPWRQRILASTCHLARRMGTLVVVKGLEKPSGFRMARWLGATLFQGYLFAVPGPIDFWQEVSFPQEWPLKTFMRTSPDGAVLPQEPPDEVKFEDTGIWPG